MPPMIVIIEKVYVNVTQMYPWTWLKGALELLKKSLVSFWKCPWSLKMSVDVFQKIPMNSQKSTSEKIVSVIFLSFVKSVREHRNFSVNNFKEFSQCQWTIKSACDNVKNTYVMYSLAWNFIRNVPVNWKENPWLFS